MNEPSKEQLSACLDGELPPGELDLLLKQMREDDELHRTADRYARIGAVLREQPSTLASSALSARIAAAIEQEPSHAVTTLKPRQRRERATGIGWFRPAISVAMAAGVATFAVLIANRPEPSQPVPLAQAPAIESATRADMMPPGVPRQVTADWAPAQLANYVVAHSEYSSPLGRTMVLNGVLAGEPQPVGGDITQEDPVDPLR